jgi:nitrilase
MYGDDPDTVISRGGSCIVDPFGNFLGGPNYEGEAILVAEIDSRADRARQVRPRRRRPLRRPDIFQLHVDERPKRPVTTERAESVPTDEMSAPRRT